MFKAKLQTWGLDKRSKKFVFFAVAGIIGFIIDSGITTLVSISQMDLIFSRLCGFSVAVLVTYSINSKFSFRGELKSTKDLIFYSLIQALGAVINFLTYWYVTKFFTIGQLSVFIGVASGSLLALFWNFGILSLYTSKPVANQNGKNHE